MTNPLRVSVHRSSVSRTTGATRTLEPLTTAPDRRSGNGTENIMEFQDRQFLRLGGRQIAFVVVALASLMLASAGAAQAQRMSGTAGADRIVGTAKADVIKSGAGNDRIEGRGGRDWLSGGRGSDRLAGGSGRDRLSGGRGSDRLAGGSGRDRLSGGRGADRLNTVDGRADRVVMGGPGTDICRVDPADEAKVKGCEIVKIIEPGAPGVPGVPGAPDVPSVPSVPGAPAAPGGPTVCAAPPEDAALARVALDDDPPPVFSDAFYAITTTITASADGLTGTDLPISIEDVCDVPQSLATEAAQLVGGDGVALITPATQVFDPTGVLLTGDAATTAVSEADTVVLKAQLLPPGGWRQDEDGAPVPTFSVSRADITD
jgi:Ca2+-binding RTX toxin-like protein